MAEKPVFLAELYIAQSWLPLQPAGAVLKAISSKETAQISSYATHLAAFAGIWVVVSFLFMKL